MNSKTLLAALTLGILAAAPAFGADAYVEFRGGSSAVSSDSITEDYPSGSGSVALDGDLMGAAAIGIDFEGGFRAELEASRRDNEVQALVIPSNPTVRVPVDGDFTVDAVMANAYYDFETSYSFTPYVMVGIGSAKAEADIDGLSLDDTAVAGQIGAGVAFDVTSVIKITAGASHFVAPSLGLGQTDVDYRSNTITGGIRFTF